MAFRYSVYEFSQLYRENEKNTAWFWSDAACFSSHHGVLFYVISFEVSGSSVQRGGPGEHRPLHMKVRTAITINYSAMRWREHWFNTLGGYPADPTVCESFVQPEQTRTFWILTYKGSFSRASPVMRGGTVLGRHYSFQPQHTEGISLTFSPSVKRLFSRPQNGFL